MTLIELFVGSAVKEVTYFAGIRTVIFAISTRENLNPFLYLNGCVNDSVNVHPIGCESSMYVPYLYYINMQKPNKSFEERERVLR